MTPILAFLAATAPAQPSAAPTQGLLFGEDYPRAAMDRGQEGSVYFGVLVGLDGRVDNCRIIKTSGYPILDTATCVIVKTRARFSPALNADHSPMYSVYKATINWSLGRHFPPVGPELEVTINQAPQDVEMPARIAVDYLSKTDGTTSNCHLHQGPPQDPAPHPQVLVDLACEALAQQPPDIIRTSAGQAVEAQNTMTIGFRVKR